LAFDVDESKFIDRKELMTLLVYGITGLCKLADIPVPHRESITQYALSVYKVIDADNSDSIDYTEFSDYIK